MAELTGEQVLELARIVDRCCIRLPRDASASWPEGVEPHDVHFFLAGIRLEEAAEEREALVKVLNAWPQSERLAAGISYIETGAVVGDQGRALFLYALGEALGLWHVMTPAKIGVPPGQQADEMAGLGFVMTTGYRRS